MTFKEIDELNPIQMDVLKEIGNIGSGNAATSLSQMLNLSIDISVPTVKALHYSEIIEFLGGPENIVVGLLIRITGEIKGMMMYILEKNFAAKIIETFYMKDVPDILECDEMERSAISEIGNIVAAAYVNAIAALSGLEINISVPSLCIDMAGAILSVPAIEFAEVSDKVIFIDDSFNISNKQINSNMILIPEMESLSTLFGRLGVDF